MATTLVQHPKMSLMRRYLAWSGMRTLRRVVEQAHAEIVWLRAQLEVALATNRRISEVNERFSEENEQLKLELERHRIIDPTYPCKVCGSREGTLKAIVEGTFGQAGRVVAQRTCKTCGFQQAHDPVSADAFKVWQPTPGQEEVRAGILGLNQ